MKGNPVRYNMIAVNEDGIEIESRECDPDDATLTMAELFRNPATHQIQTFKLENTEQKE